MARINDYINRLKTNLSNLDLFLIWDSDLNRTSVVRYGNLKTSLSKIYIIRSEVNNVEGGVAVSELWTTLPLTELVYDDTLNVIFSNVNYTFELSSGKYDLELISSFTNTGKTRLRLVNANTNSPVLYSMSYNVTNTQQIVFKDTFNVLNSTSYKIEYFCELAGTITALGNPCNNGIPELYTQLMLTKR